MPKVKLEATEEDSKPVAKRIKKEEEEHGDNVEQADDDAGVNASMMLARLEALEAENRRLRARITTLEALSPLKLVEFKFRSRKTYLIDEGCMTGTLHVPMLQDPYTGKFTIPCGTTLAKGVCQRIVDTSTWRSPKCSRIDTEHFTARFVRKEGEPIAKFHLGYALDWYLEDEMEEWVVPMTVPKSETDQYATRSGFTAHSTHLNRKSYTEVLHEWETNGGGMLSVSAHGEFDGTDEVEGRRRKASYKIKLYTVLSAHKPCEEPMPLEPDAKPNWKFLEQVLQARFPSKDEHWAGKAVREYINFLELKKEHSDYDSSKFMPSSPINEVWRAHLSFIDRYQDDVRAFTESETLIEPSPITGEEAFQRYYAAYKAHVERMKALRKNVDNEFWPEPEYLDLVYEEDHDGDSDDHLEIGEC